MLWGDEIPLVEVFLSREGKREEEGNSEAGTRKKKKADATASLARREAKYQRPVGKNSRAA